MQTIAHTLSPHAANPLIHPLRALWKAWEARRRELFPNAGD